MNCLSEICTRLIYSFFLVDVTDHVILFLHVSFNREASFCFKTFVHLSDSFDIKLFELRVKSIDDLLNRSLSNLY